ncbi:MAG: TetR/AcrR family transcriptional regulator, partial [Gammaproteobacteria bacterium]|nr:TetR/AcrR family transcriptional regulator [Gammaproteobacteria bacterium]
KLDTRSLILKEATQLFSEKGFEGVSMRDIAVKVNISAAALYNHFSDKQSLYLDAIADTFSNKAEKLELTLASSDTPLERLELFISQYCELIHADPYFSRLMRRELLDGDERRLDYLAHEVFLPIFSSVKELLLELKPDCDPNSLMVIIDGMLQKPFELKPLMQFFPGSEDHHTDPAYITSQLMAVLSAYFGESK